MVLLLLILRHEIRDLLRRHGTELVERRRDVRALVNEYRHILQNRGDLLLQVDPVLLFNAVSPSSERPNYV